MQTDMVLEKESRFLHLVQQTAGRETETLDLDGAFETSKPSLIDTLSPIRPHTIIPTRPHLIVVSRSTTPKGISIQIDEHVGTILIQTPHSPNVWSSYVD